MALMNRKLAPELETVFMMPAEAYSYLSSRLVKEIARLGGSIAALVPELVQQRLREKIQREPERFRSAASDAAEAMNSLPVPHTEPARPNGHRAWPPDRRREAAGALGSGAARTSYSKARTKPKARTRT